MTNDTKLTLTVEEAANLLGIGRQLAYDLVRTGRLPALRLGHRYVVPRAAIMRMLADVTAADLR